MLIGIDPLLSPPLLFALAEMGHGDTLAIVDANFPAASVHPRVIRLDGADAVATLGAVLTVLPVDTFVPHPVAVMQVVGDPAAVPPVVHAFRAQLAAVGTAADAMTALDRDAFYARARAAFAIVATTERRLYGNVLVTKGIVAPPG